MPVVTDQFADARQQQIPAQKRQRRILFVLPFLPASVEKCAHILILQRCLELGWGSTVLACNLDERTKVGEQQRMDVDWQGVRIIRTVPNGIRWRVSKMLHAMRPSAVDSSLRLGPLKLPAGISRMVDLCLRPLSAAVGFPDQFIGLRRRMLREGIALHREQPFDVVLSFFHPFSSHLIARRLARQLGVPWVAVTQDYYSWPDELEDLGKGRLANRLKRRYERHTLSRSSAVLAVNDNLADYLRGVLPSTQVEMLAHCYDDDDFERHDPSSECGDGIFRLVSTGLVARTEQPGLQMLFAAVGELLQEKHLSTETFRIRFVGHGGEIVRSCAERARCSAVIEICPPIPHDHAMLELKQAPCLLFQQAQWGMRRRFAEYFGARKPILAFPSYPGSMSERLLGEYGAAEVAADKDSLKRVLKSWHDRFQCDGRLALDVNEPLVRTFSASHRARELDAMLTRVLDTCRPSIDEES